MAAVQYDIYLFNRMPSRVLGFKTLLQTLAAHVPVSSHLNLTSRIFGCVAYVHLNKSHMTKLDQSAHRCVFVGFAPQQMGYWCYHPSSCHFNVTMDVMFVENKMFLLSNVPHHVLEGI
ncbi:unnamed protein product [Prunus armeniaca]